MLKRFRPRPIHTTVIRRGSPFTLAIALTALAFGGASFGLLWLWGCPQITYEVVKSKITGKPIIDEKAIVYYAYVNKTDQPEFAKDSVKLYFHEDAGCPRLLMECMASTLTTSRGAKGAAIGYVKEPKRNKVWESNGWKYPWHDCAKAIAEEKK